MIGKTLERIYCYSTGEKLPYKSRFGGGCAGGLEGAIWMALVARGIEGVGEFQSGDTLKGGF